MRKKTLVDLTVGDAMKAGIIWHFVVYPFFKGLNRQVVRQIEMSKTFKKYYHWLEKDLDRLRGESNG